MKQQIHWTGAVLLAVLLCRSAVAAETAGRLRSLAEETLAQLEGEVSVPGLRAPVEVLRDRWGVPHIYARNQHDLFFAQGFVAAQDRLFQIDMWRRIAVGETAEVLGPDAVVRDRFARLMKYRGDEEQEWNSYSPDTRQIASAFVRGINAYIDQVAQRLPIEFQLLGYRPKKWAPEDVLGRMSVLPVAFNLRREVARARLVAAVGVEKARMIMPADPPVPFAPAPGLDLSGIGDSLLEGYTAVTSAVSFGSNTGGSNNWVVDSTLSESGKPLLASDPHRSLAIPSLRYLVHLNAPGWNVIGSGEPALPGVAIGHNERIAWGFTVVLTDQADLFVEETNPANPTQYRVGDRWQEMETIEETVQVKGGEPVSLQLHYTRHGPVIHEDRERHRAYALRWIGSEPGTAAYLAALAVDRAGSWPEFLQAVRRWKAPSENLVYADVDGDIGWVAAALTPVRKGWRGLLPAPGASGEYRWQGFLELEDLPQAHNPPHHYLGTANHNILPAGYPHEIGYDWVPGYRWRRIRESLESKKTFTLADFRSMQFDNVSIPALQLAQLLVTTPLSAADLRPYVRLMASWDGSLTRQSPQAALYAFWLQELLDAFFGMQVPDELLSLAQDRTGILVMMTELRQPSPAWFGDEPARKRDELLQQTLARAVRKTAAALGDSPQHWAWGDLHHALFVHPLGELGRAYADVCNVGPIPCGAGPHTPDQARYDEHFRRTHGPSYRQLFDLADWDRGLATSAPGQSGQPGSPHYADLASGWANGQYFPLAFSRKKVEEVTLHRLILEPAD